MPAGAAGESGRAGQRFAAGERLEPAPELVGQRCFERPIVLFVRAHSVCAQARLRERRDLCGERLGGLASAAFGYDAMDEPDRERFVCANRTSGEDQIERAREADQPREPDRSSVDERHAPAAAENAEHRVFFRDAQIAPQRELEPAGDGVPADCSDDGFFQQHSRGPHRSITVRRDAIAVPLRERLQIRPGTERTFGPPQDRDVRSVVLLELPERVCQRKRSRAVDRIFHLRTCQDDGRDVAALLDAEHGREHSRSRTMGEPCPMLESMQDAERACAYVIERVKRAAGARWAQGSRAPAFDARGGGRAVQLVAEQRLWRVSRAVAAGLVAWANGERDVVLLDRVPAPNEVLAFQAVGRRCVSLLPEGTDRDGLEFALHDLCHLEKFSEPEFFAEQVGFFARLRAAMNGQAWRDFDARYDEAWRRDVEHVAADMNGSAIFLFAALKMKLKMAVRRDLARRHGRPPPTGGPLADDEERAFADALETLLGALEIDGEARVAASAVSTKRDAPDSARLLARWFSAWGMLALHEGSNSGARALSDGNGVR